MKKGKYMKKLSLLLGILLFIGIGYLAFLNMNQPVNFAYFSSKMLKDFSLGLIFIIVAACSSLAASLICTSKIIELNEQSKKQMRNAEKASIETGESKDKVKNLQAKIDTLEIALKEALAKK
jgi:uncharacterized integral membrane protein